MWYSQLISESYRNKKKQGKAVEGGHVQYYALPWLLPLYHQLLCLWWVCIFTSGQRSYCSIEDVKSISPCNNFWTNGSLWIPTEIYRSTVWQFIHYTIRALQESRQLPTHTECLLLTNTFTIWLYYGTLASHILAHNGEKKGIPSKKKLRY